MEQAEVVSAEEFPRAREDHDYETPVDTERKSAKVTSSRDSIIDSSPRPEPAVAVYKIAARNTAVETTPAVEDVVLPETTPSELIDLERSAVFEPRQPQLIDEATEPLTEDFTEGEAGIMTIDSMSDYLERQPVPENVALEIFEDIEVRISELEPETIEATNEILSKIVRLTREIQNPEITAESFEETETELIELCAELFEVSGLDYSEEEIEQVARLWITHSRLNFVTENRVGRELNHLFDDLGTHEGLKYFLAGLKRIKQVVEDIYSVLGRFALGVFTQTAPL